MLDGVRVCIEYNKVVVYIPQNMDGAKYSAWLVKNNEELEKFKLKNIKNYTENIIPKNMVLNKDKITNPNSE